MDILIWIGAAVTVLGFAGVVWSIVLVMRARRAGLDDAGMRQRLQTALPVNVGALLLSLLGLMLVVVAIVLS
jgi:hypothetical protein